MTQNDNKCNEIHIALRKRVCYYYSEFKGKRKGLQKCSPFCYAMKGVLLDGMTAKQKRFCDEYLIDLNATQAAIRSGYSEKTAYRTGADNLKKPQIREYIDQRMAEKEAELIADQNEVLKYLTSVMRGNSTSEEIVVEGTGEGCSEARTMEKAPSEKDRLKAAELLGKRYSLFTDRVETDVDMDLNITIDYGEDDAG